MVSHSLSYSLTSHSSGCDTQCINAFGLGTSDDF